MALILPAVRHQFFSLRSLPRAGFQIGLVSLLLLSGAASVRVATAANETRTLSFHHVHSGEDLAVTFERHIAPALQLSTTVGNAPMAGVKAVATKERPGRTGPGATSMVAAASVDKPWMRILLLSPSISDSASVTMLGNEDLTLMRAFFVKPQTVIKSGFSDDPMMGMTCDHFSGSSSVKLQTVSFAQRSAALQGPQ